MDEVNREILKKVEEYRASLILELFGILSVERKNEEERERVMKEADDDNNKKLEKIYGRERAIASNKIVQFNK